VRRAILVLGTTAAGLAALLSYKTHVAGIAVASTAPAAPTVTAPSMTPSNGSALAASASASPSPSKSAKKKSTPKPTPAKSTQTAAQPAAAATTPAPTKSSAPARPSGNFTGPNENTRYGPVQVQITVANGKITAANDVQQPSDSIAANAVSQLNQEVLTAQSANIQSVSGATYTSQGYIGSLQQAVNQAGL
jgi:uncharacterized protein with FMN-binding domain